MVKRKCANCLYADGCIDRKVACGNFYPVDDELLNDKQIKRMIDERLESYRAAYEEYIGADDENPYGFYF